MYGSPTAYWRGEFGEAWYYSPPPRLVDDSSPSFPAPNSSIADPNCGGHQTRETKPYQGHLVRRPGGLSIPSRRSPTKVLKNK